MQEYANNKTEEETKQTAESGSTLHALQTLRDCSSRVTILEIPS
jgi:hypothetical protein